MWVEVDDESDLPDHHASHIISSLSGKSEYAWKVRTFCRERGRFRLGPITLTSGDPFGLFRIKYHLAHTSNVVVYPNTVPLRSFPLPIGMLPGGDALRRRTHYITTNASGVRDYAPGDPFNRIHWKSTARKDRLIVKEFELDPLADVWLILDLWSGAHYGDRRLPDIDLDDMDLLAAEEGDAALRAAAQFRRIRHLRRRLDRAVLLAPRSHAGPHGDRSTARDAASRSR